MAKDHARKRLTRKSLRVELSIEMATHLIAKRQENLHLSRLEHHRVPEQVVWHLTPEVSHLILLGRRDKVHIHGTSIKRGAEHIVHRISTHPHRRIAHLPQPIITVTPQIMEVAITIHQQYIRHILLTDLGGRTTGITHHLLQEDTTHHIAPLIRGILQRLSTMNHSLGYETKRKILALGMTRNSGAMLHRDRHLRKIERISRGEHTGHVGLFFKTDSFEIELAKDTVNFTE